MAHIEVPRDVRAAGKALLRTIGGYLTEQGLVPEPHELIVLVEAARTADRLAQIRAALVGADLTDASTVRLITEERQQRTALAGMLLSKLGLATGVAGGVGSTPMSRRGQSAVIHRWGRGGGGRAS